jgi:Ni/Co efflux regulator RcnB
MNIWIKRLSIVLGVAVMTGGPAFAEKPSEPGNSGAKKSQSNNSSGASKHYDSKDSADYFNSDRRSLIKNYYTKSAKSGNCPPGLAKKNNGCQPPGQMKKWQRGNTLPGNVVYYDLPAALIAELGRTPEGAKVVQVGTDVLLVSIATGIILDVFDSDE